jgi:hypothetical protein
MEAQREKERRAEEKRRAADEKRRHVMSMVGRA